MSAITLSTVFDKLPMISKKQVLKSMVGSFNSSIIGYLRSHIRNSKFENSSRDGEPQTIDKFNEAMAALDETAADAVALEGMGLTVAVKPLDVARNYMSIRAYFIAKLADAAQLPSDVPLTLEDTLEFQIKRAPDINMPVLQAISKAIGVDVETLKLKKVQMHNADRDELIDTYGQILTLSMEIDHGEEDHDEIEHLAEQAFGALPLHLQYKVMVTIARSMERAADKALEALLRYSRLAAAGDLSIIKGAHADVCTWLSAFLKQHLQALAEYQEKSGQQLQEVAPLL